MTYIYDILLNFNEVYFEFYDWNKSDKIIHVKKIPVYKVDNKTLKDIVYSKVKLSANFLELIKDKTEVFYKHEIGKISYGCLLYSSKKMLAINVDKDGLIIGFSDLLVDEYTEILETLDEPKYVRIEYEVMDEFNVEEFKTRNYIEKERFVIKILYKLSIDQLKYIYYEIFLENETSREKILNSLIKLKDKEEIYNLIKCMTGKYKKIK